MSRLLKLRVILFAFVSVLSVATLTAGVLVAASEGSRSLSLLCSAQGWSDLMAISVSASFIPGTVGAIVGAAVAVRMIRNAQAQSPGKWIRLGCIYGLVGGAFVTAMYFAILNAGTEEAWLLVAEMSPVGGVAGAVTGTVLGAYCSHVMKLHRRKAA